MPPHSGNPTVPGADRCVAHPGRSKPDHLQYLAARGLAILLSSYTDSEDVVFGAMRACRRSSVPGSESMVGLLINTLPVRARVTPRNPS